MTRYERLARLSLLTGVALAALLVAKQGRDYKAIAGLACALAAATAIVAAATSPPSGTSLARLAALRRCLPGPPRLAALLATVFVPVAAYAALQKLGWDPVEEFVRFHSASRPFATFGNPDFLGAFTALLLPLLLGRLKAAGSRLSSIGNLSLVIAAALVLVWTGSRGAWLGALFGAMLWGMLAIARREVALAWLLIRKSPAGALALPTGFAIFALALLPPVWDALGRRTDRLMLWEGTARMFRAHPIAGWGPGRFAQEYMPYAPPAFAKRMKDDNTFAEHPHSEYLHIWVEYGAVGLGAFAWLLIVVIRHGLQLARSRDPVLAGVVGGLVAILVHIAVDRNFRLASTAVPFWTLAASLFAIAPRGRAPIAPPPGHPAPGLIAALVAVSVAAVVSFRPLVASYRVEREGDFLKQAADVPAAELEGRRETMKADPNYWIALGNAWAKEKQFPRALASFQEALRLAPGLTSAANNLGNCYFMMSRFDEAAGVYRGMLARDPLHADARFNLAFTYYHQRRIKEALAEVAVILEREPANAKALALRAQLAP